MAPPTRQELDYARFLLDGECYKGNLNEVKRLMEEFSFDVNVPNGDGNAVLHYAS
eukprot:CAMPEP_0119564654 /NCGR_PEP_ID=MMETSP1352-20130426/27625_1 /TAXON_ID=265584 /ORGANISM="Stauroneis constricta, Strain CCMP1120" /LENGTH=54 /DNA_ID=CAMNT_0007613429 /DNA_START=98 /DNA_END=259 /DNA_ORIENTATION=-